MNKTLESPIIVSVLNRLLQTLCRSLALYTEEIKPWSLAGRESLWTAIGCLAADSRMSVSYTHLTLLTKRIV